MSQVTIVGGGLTGILAAFEAHRLGARDIVLHERFGQLGGLDLPRTAHGLELRDRCTYFGAAGDPVRSVLESHGVAFEDFKLHCGSVSPSRGGDLVWSEDLDGPALPTRSLTIAPQVGHSLSDRLRAYPDEIGRALSRYCQWRLGVWLNEVHESAAVGLAVDRVLPFGQAPEELGAQPEFYAGPQAAAIAGLPRGGLASLFAQCERSLIALGVTVCVNSLVSPQHVLAARQPGETVVWAANPTPLFKPLGLEAPVQLGKSLATYIVTASYVGNVPFRVRNFTAQGAVAQLYLYESRGQLLVLAECVEERGETELRSEIVRLMAGFGGASLTLGEQISAHVGPRQEYLSVDAPQKLKTLRVQLTRDHGAAFVPGAWEIDAPGEGFAQLRARLAAALAPSAISAVA